ncbi:hypothetical protein [Oceanicaulis sp.]|uniref:hypothetical protein n=1 Tax=Oceanicaulis sp. TaxID=1924941 RepID=UPI003BA89CBA
MIALILASTALLIQSEPALSAYPLLDPEAQARLEFCEVDAARFDALMALNPQSFDQDFSGGWRPVGNTSGCERAAADLLIAYMDHSPHFNPERPGVIGWHAGQMLAMAGEAELAIAYFDAARSVSPEWNLYVDATLAFMRRDRPAAEAARAELATLRPSEEEMAARRQFLADNPRIRMPEGFVEQPENLAVVDRLLRCWDAPYADAYSGACRG